MKPFVLGLVGERGAGKSTFASSVMTALSAARRTAVYVKSSDVLNETLALWGIETSTENLQRLGRTMRDAYGFDVIPNVMARRLGEADSDVAIWDGIRWAGDEHLIRSLSKAALIYVTAPAELRYQRLTGRTEKAEERRGIPVTLAEFSTAEAQENEREIPQIGARADFIVANTGSAEELKLRALHLLRSLRLLEE